MLKFLSIVAVFTAVNSGAAHACSCMPFGSSFFETVFLHNQKVAKGEWPSTMALSIVTAEVKDYLSLRNGPQPTEMILNVRDVVQGTVTAKEIIVQGDDGKSCMPYVTQFAKNKKYIFALNQNGNDYYISACGFYSKEVAQP